MKDMKQNITRGLIRRFIDTLRDQLRFLFEWLFNPLSVGALAPSGRGLSRMMAQQVDPSIPGVVIELGPGTGPVTKALLERGIDEERLLLIEYNQDFSALLRARFPKARIVTGDAYDITKLATQLNDQPIAAIISSLPLFSKPLEQRRTLIMDVMKLLDKQSNNAFIQFTYAPIPPVAHDPTCFSLRGTRRVWLNIFPAKVWVYQPAD